MKEAVSIHVMSEDHIDGLLAVEKSSRENFWNRGAFKKHLSMKNHYGVVACDSGKPVGFMVYEERPAWDHVQIWNMVVTPSSRRDGVGSAMFEAVKAKVPERYGRIVFNVRESNTGAHLFLKKLGFWCVAIARKYFVDKIKETVRRENAYCFDYNPSANRSKDEPICITGRFGSIVARPLSGGRKDQLVDISEGHRSGQGQP